MCTSAHRQWFVGGCWAPPRAPEAEGAIEAVTVSIVKGTLRVRDVSRHFINLNDAAKVSDP